MVHTVDCSMHTGRKPKITRAWPKEMAKKRKQAQKHEAIATWYVLRTYVSHIVPRCTGVYGGEEGSHETREVVEWGG